MAWTVPKWLSDVFFSFLDLTTPESVPTKVQFPVEGTPMQLKTSHICKRVITDNVNHWTHNTSPVLSNSGDQAFKPAWGQNNKKSVYL
jgi:hypothetical protein